MEICYKVLNDLNDETINGFYNSFHKSNRTSEEFKWEFCNSPKGKSIYVHAITPQGKVVGAISVIPLEMINGLGETLLTGKPEDTMVDIFARLKYRKTDILKEMYDLLEQECKKIGIEVLWGFTYEIKPFLRLGFETSFHSLQGTFVIKPFSAYNYLCSLNKNNRLKEKIKIALLVAVSAVLKYRSFFILGQIPGKVIFDDYADHEDLLLKHLNRDQTCFCLNQNNEYLNWRIKINPNKLSYQVVTLTNNKGEKEAEIIYSTHQNTGFIEQIIFLKTLNPKHVLRMLKYVEKNLKKENISLIRFMGFNSSLLNKKEIVLLKKFGFVFINRGIPVVFKKIGNIPIDITPNNIFLSRLYTQGNV